MARRVFYSFHYDPDNWRASQIREIGSIEGNAPASDNDWETVKKGGDPAIEKWIKEQLDGRSCTVVLIGAQTADRKWIDYEIKKSWGEKKGLLGVYVHNLKDSAGKQTKKGKNPFDGFTINDGKTALNSLVKSYDPPYSESKQVYAHIKDNLSNWIEEAIKIRENV